MDTFVDSSWYFMRFPDPKNQQKMFSPESANGSLPVDIYIGGVEHAILHLLYARFISKFVATTPLWPDGWKSLGEPFKQVLTQGMVHGRTYSDPSNGRFLKPEEVDLRDPLNPLVVASGQTAKVTFEKMSKSKYNGVDPGTCMARYGADATRAHILFQAPVSEVLEWDEERISGITRWLRRLHEHISKHEAEWMINDAMDSGNAKSILLKQQDGMELLNHPGVEPYLKTAFPKLFEEDKKLWRQVQATISSVTESYAKSYSLNTVVSDLMALTNAVIDHQNFTLQGPHGGRNLQPHLYINRYAVVELLKMMAPITPAFAEECWTMLNPPPPGFLLSAVAKVVNFFRPGMVRHSTKWHGSIFDAPFPTTDGTFDMLAPITQACAVQVNGRLRLVVELPALPSELKGKELEDWIVKEILDTEDGKKRLAGPMENGKSQVDIKKAKKVIVVRGGKTVNFIV
jgi:leucyl-tRNA synthetase